MPRRDGARQRRLHARPARSICPQRGLGQDARAALGRSTGTRVTADLRAGSRRPMC